MERASWRKRLCGHLFHATGADAAPTIVGLFAAVATLDVLSPRYITFGAFYLVIIAYASWAIGRRGGWLAAVAVITVALLSDGFGGYVALATGRAHTVAATWSIAMRLLSSAAIIELVRGFRHSFEHARKLSETDPLTGVLDRRAFRTVAARSLARTHAGGRTGVIVFADMDGFKQVNDRLGHAVGDEVLTQFAAMLQEAVRPGDPVARNGGDEFTACLDVPDEQAARQAVLRLQRTLKEGLARLGYSGLSCSLGATLVEADEPLPPLDQLLARADELMYRAKQSRFVQLSSGAA